MDGLPKRKNIRLVNFDYSSRGYYFLTVVTRHRLELFGQIDNGQMMMNDAGRMVEDCYEMIAEEFPDVECMDQAVMPNHFHCLLRLTDKGVTHVAAVMRWWKSITTNRYIHGVKEQGWPPFAQSLWQGRYYDHIIRDQRDFDMIRNYIQENPQRWDKDCINPMAGGDM